MKRVSAAVLAGILMTSTALAAATSTAAQGQSAPAVTRANIPTIEQLAAFPTYGGFAVSPNGQHMAAMQARGEDRIVVVWDATNLSKPPVEFGTQLMKYSGVRFIKDGVIAVSAFQRWDDGNLKTFIGKTYFRRLDGGNFVDPLQNIQVRSEAERQQLNRSSVNIIDTLPNDPDHILILVSGEIYKYNVRRNSAERVMRLGERVIGVETDLTGEVRARTIVDRDAEGLAIITQFRQAGGDWQEHVRNHVKEREVFSVAGFTADPNIAYVISNRGRDKAAIFEYDIAAKKLADEPAFAHPLFEASGVGVWSTPGPNFGEPAAFYYQGLRGEMYPALPEFEQLKATVEQRLGVRMTPTAIVDPETGQARTIPYAVGRYAEIRAVSRDLNTAVVWAGSATDPGAYYLVKNRTEISRLMAPHPDIKPETLGTASYAYYGARDGLQIPAFVYKPSAALYGPGPYPTIIMPHGGPWSRDTLDWDGSMWPQLLTSRGYAVIQPQFRGSDGWGKRLWMAGDNEWGQKMQDDLDDAAKWAVEQNLAAQGRIAMFGFSYGGYAAMVAAIRPNGLYKCAVAGAGVGELTRIRSSLFANPYTREAQRDTVNGLNPASQSRNISIPILVYHGDRDQTVQLEQSALFLAGARQSGQDVQYRELADFAHGPSWTRATQAEHLKMLEDYFKTGCAGGL